MKENDHGNEAAIIESWQRNAPAWVVAVREGQIESRRQVTDAAILDTVLSLGPATALDIGCGEGWLAHKLASHNISVIGVDAVPALIDEAQQAGDGEFRVLSYADLAAGKLPITVDACICNFSLLGKESVDAVFTAVPTLLARHGHFIIQTLHPTTACGEQGNQDGWREGSWRGFNSDFTDPAPWYFRTLEAWHALFSKHDLQVVETREPRAAATAPASSIIFIAQRRR